MAGYLNSQRNAQATEIRRSGRATPPSIFCIFPTLKNKTDSKSSVITNRTLTNPKKKKKNFKKKKKIASNRIEIEIATPAAVTERPLIEKHNNHSNGHCSSQALFLPQEPNQTLPQWWFSLLQHGIYCFVSRHGLIQQDSSLFLSI